MHRKVREHGSMGLQWPSPISKVAWAMTAQAHDLLTRDHKSLGSTFPPFDGAHNRYIIERTIWASKVDAVLVQSGKASLCLRGVCIIAFRRGHRIDREPLVLSLSEPHPLGSPPGARTRPFHSTFHHGFPLRPPYLATTLPAPPGHRPRTLSRAAPILAPPRPAVLLQPCQRSPSTRGVFLRLRVLLQSTGAGPRR